MYALDVVGGVLLSGINWLLIAEEIGVVARVGEGEIRRVVERGRHRGRGALLRHSLSDRP